MKNELNEIEYNKLMASQGNARKMRNGLTPKQNGFKNKVIEQIKNGQQPNLTQAALAVYDTEDPKAASVIATRNLENDSIAQAIDRELESQGWNSSENLKEIIGLAKSEPKFIPAGIKLQANIELLKLRGKYPGTKNHESGTKNITQNINITYSEAKDRISELNGVSTDFVADAEAS